MGRHLTGDDLDRLRRGRLPADELLAMSEHLAECEVCRRAGDAHRFLSALAPEEHLDPDSQLYPYVEGALDPAGLAEVEGHLATCERCREDVADLRSVAAGLSRPAPPTDGRLKPAATPWIVAGAIAAAAAIAVVVLYAWTPAPAVPAGPIKVDTMAGPAVPSNPWHELLRSAIAAGRVEEPAVLQKLRPRPESLRGPASPRSSLRTPVGVVVESVRPRFSWAPAHRTTYRVSVFDGDRLIAQSPFLASEEWVCDRSLERGAVYSWQVEVRKGSERMVMPEPPEGDALFEVLAEDAARDLADARRQFPDDHLLAGVLYAHYGCRERAEEEMQLATADPKQAADARRLIDSLRHWQS
jgi:anti-sigma factor RsiW